MRTALAPPLAVAASLLAAGDAARADTWLGVLPPGFRNRVELVWVDDLPASFPPPEEAVVLEHHDREIVPSLTVARVGQPVVFENDTTRPHAVLVVGPAGRGPGRPVPEADFERRFVEPGAYRVACRAHPSTVAWILVVPTPWFTRPDPASGAYVLHDVPRGRHTLRAWGRRLDAAERALRIPITVGAPPTDPRPPRVPSRGPAYARAQVMPRVAARRGGAP